MRVRYRLPSVGASDPRRLYRPLRRLPFRPRRYAAEIVCDERTDPLDARGYGSGWTDCAIRPIDSHEFRLSAARDETVSFQVVVTAPQSGLTGVTLAASRFRNASGAKTRAIGIALYREHFSDVTKPSPIHGHPKSLGPRNLSRRFDPFH